MSDGDEGMKNPTMVRWDGGTAKGTQRKREPPLADSLCVVT